MYLRSSILGLVRSTKHKLPSIDPVKEEEDRLSGIVTKEAFNQPKILHRMNGARSTEGT